MNDGWLSPQVARLEERAPWLRRLTGPLHRHRWLRWLGGAVGAFVLLLFLGFNLLWFSLDLPEEPPRLQSAVVLAADGGELATFSSEGVRFDLELREIAPVAVEAVLAAEDRRYYEHTGVDPLSVARAIWRDLRGGRQGGSTITQQLVKNDYLTSERNITRKLKEAVLAVKLDRSADKDEILARYLNTVYFGRRAYGIEAAARAYFARPAAELEAAQAALLAGLIRSPETADPTDDPEEALRRRRSVLRAMVKEDVITSAEGGAAEASPLDAIDPTQVETDAVAAPHFVDRVRQEAVEAVGAEAVEGGGVRIQTTLDLRMQRAAETAVAEVLKDEPGPQAALVALDTDGAIRAYVGGRDHEALKLDLVRGTDGGGTGRQPGSTFKPFLLAAALSKGTTLGERLPAPAQLELEVEGRPWSVDNYENKAYGAIDVQRATADSVNTVYAQLLQRVGTEALAASAKAFGISTPMDPVPALVLGATETSPLDVARAYGTLANDGLRTEPYAIDRIESSEGVVMWQAPKQEPARMVAPEISRGVTYALQQVIADGTGKGAKLGRPAAGKTGTTQNNVDAWFAGYVPGFTAVVWMGDPNGSVRIETARGRGITGGGLPATIWQRFMGAAVEGRKPDGFPGPPDNMLKAPSAPTLTATPDRVLPGDTVEVRGDGFQTCQASWSVQVEGTTLASVPEQGSLTPNRSAAFVLPPELPPTSYRIVATCDDGTGPKPVAESTFRIELPALPTTTTTTAPTFDTVPDDPEASTTTTTTPAAEQSDGATTTSSTTTTTASAPTTTTTRPRR